MPYEITKAFLFDAAHQLASNVTPDHIYAGVHGHSFEAELAFAGEPDPETGWLRDLGEIDRILNGIRDQLDHKYLNEVPGLEKPTLENICAWIWQRVKPALPELVRVTVRRGSFREGCTYTGPSA